MYDEDRRLSELRTAAKDGFAEGFAEGVQEGVKEGMKEAKLESARNLKTLGVSDEIVAQATGLPLETVQAL